MNEPLLSFPQQDIFMYNKFRGQPGYAITEVLVATVVLSIGFIELTNAYSNISRVANQAVAMTKASNLSHATMERIISQNFDAKGNEAGDYALVFDGTDDYVDIGNVATGIKTISFWVEADDISTHTDYVIDLNGTDYIKIVNGEVTVNNIDSPTYYINAIADERTIATIDAWYHVAITTATGMVADDVDIGRVEGVDTEFFFGKIDEVRLWNDVRTASEILTYYNKSYPNPYDDNTLKLYYKLNNGSGSIVYDYSSSISHGTITNAIWTSQSSSWSITLGREGEAKETIWSTHNDVDDFHTISFVDSDYTGLAAGSNNFSGLGGRIYVKYVSLNTGGAPYTFDDSGTPTDYKQITVKVGIPGSTDSTQLNAIKTAKAEQGYTLTFSPYGL